MAFIKNPTTLDEARSTKAHLFIDVVPSFMGPLMVNEKLKPFMTHEAMRYFDSGAI